ncbi:MAG: polysaccharide pyruvyl transferase CsaB [Syntrophomonadaceae bacterium]|nr:polysaccharide pyruvyl transferase CsaB [Syntrophomonadaceae bacterium]
MKIALSGYYGFDNAGDEALLAAITSSLKSLQPEAEFVVFSGNPGKTSSLHGFPAVYHKNPLAVIHELRSSDLLISGGGSIFQDITSPFSLPYYISVVVLAKLLGKPVVFYAQGVGPINRSFSKFLMRLVANRVDLITLRDSASSRFLFEMGVSRPPMLVTADPVFSLEPRANDQTMIKSILTSHGIASQPLIGVAVRKWKALDGYQEILAKVLDDLAHRGYGIIFVAMSYPEDVSESRQVASLMQSPTTVLDQHLSSQEHLALIDHLDLMIAIRLHALIFAANRGIPFAGISYDPKVEAFLGSFGLSPLPLDFTGMKQQVDSLLEDTNLQAHIRSKAGDMRAKAADNARLALSLIRRDFSLRSK